MTKRKSDNMKYYLAVLGFVLQLMVLMYQIGSTKAEIIAKLEGHTEKLSDQEKRLRICEVHVYKEAE